MEHIQPPDMNEPGIYAHAIRAGNMLFMAGQVARDKEGNVVGAGDVAAQADQAWKNIGSILRAAGGSYSNIVKVTTYLVNMEHRTAMHEVQRRYLGSHLPTHTLIGVAALARPEFLIEVDATAVLE